MLIKISWLTVLQSVAYRLDILYRCIAPRTTYTIVNVLRDKLEHCSWTNADIGALTDG